MVNESSVFESLKFYCMQDNSESLGFQTFLRHVRKMVENVVEFDALSLIHSSVLATYDMVGETVHIAQCHKGVKWIDAIFYYPDPV